MNTYRIERTLPRPPDRSREPAGLPSAPAANAALETARTLDRFDRAAYVDARMKVVSRRIPFGRWSTARGLALRARACGAAAETGAVHRLGAIMPFSCVLVVIRPVMNDTRAGADVSSSKFFVQRIVSVIQRTEGGEEYKGSSPGLR